MMIPSFLVIFGDKNIGLCCKDLLNGKVWKGRTILAETCRGKKVYTLFVSNIDAALADREIYSELSALLDGIFVKQIIMGQLEFSARTRCLYIGLSSKHGANIAFQRLNGYVFHGLPLRIRPYNEKGTK